MEVRQVFYKEPIHVPFGQRRNINHEFHPNMVVLDINNSPEEQSLAAKAGMTALLQPDTTTVLHKGETRMLFERTPQSDGLAITVSEDSAIFQTHPAIDSEQSEGKTLKLSEDYTIAIGEKTYVNDRRVTAVSRMLLIRRSGLHTQTQQPTFAGGGRL